VFVVAWLVGSFVRSGRVHKALEAQAADQRRAAESAVADERSRLARELHDIVSHNLSVVVLQAGGARAQGSLAAPGALEKIERSGREALFEMRRLLGVLRGDDEVATLAPQPGLEQIPPLVERIRAAGVPVELSIGGDRAGLSPALELSVYRIVQEALTNVLKHAGPASARVGITCAQDAITVEVVDDGRGSGTPPSSTGRGLVGMQERVALLGGSLRTAPGPHGGFVVQARLPVKAA
jgi:signal transduction histidine kinase